MGNHRETVIRSATTDSDLPEGFALQLIEDEPWLDGLEELSEEIAIDLLAQAASAFHLCTSQISAFVDRYNLLVRAVTQPDAARQNEAYALFAHTLRPFGQAADVGEGDFWLVDDSFSTKHPHLMIFGEFRLPTQAIMTLQRVLNQFGDIFIELRIAAEDETEICILRPE